MRLLIPLAFIAIRRFGADDTGASQPSLIIDLFRSERPAALSKAPMLSPENGEAQR
jgi:hypothetical protein